MAHATHPSHSGEAISILKVEPNTDQGLVVTSTAVDIEGRIAARYTPDGEDLSPPLEWTEIEGAGAYVLIVEDPDAPFERPFVHWLAWNIPGQLTALPEGLPLQPRLITPQDMIQGRNNMGVHGWFGPRPPLGHGVHHYYFQLFAIDAPLELEPDADLVTLVDAIKGRTLAHGSLIGTYEARE